MIVFGIDPGVTGAVAALENGEFVGVHDLPLTRDTALAWADASQLRTLLRELAVGTGLRSSQPMRAYVERVHFVKRGGVLHAPVILGSILATLDIWGCPVTLVQASNWKRSMGLLAPGVKDAERKKLSLFRARRMFPNADLPLAKDHNKAEALLIAAYGAKVEGLAREAA